MSRTRLPKPGPTPYLDDVRFNRSATNHLLYRLDRDLIRAPLPFTRLD